MMSANSIQDLGSLAGIGGDLGPREIARPEPAGESSFADALGSALGKVDRLQVEADVQADKVAMGGGNLHEMSLALEKADVSMRLAMKVRQKLVDAYQEIMRMSV
jgi:flagellar hook-basal body complex protein FliE